MRQLKVNPLYMSVPVFLLPAWGAGLGLMGLILVHTWVFLRKGLNLQLLVDILVFLVLLVVLLGLQSQINAVFQGEIFASVARADLRTSQTLGWYEISGAQNYFFILKLVFNLFVFIVLLNNFKNLPANIFKKFLWRVTYFSIFLQLAIYLLVETGGMADIFKAMVGQGGIGGATNYLTQDSVGYRISIGFYEPSQMSTFMGGVFSALLVLKNSTFEKIVIAIMIIILFLTSRSFAIVLLPIMAVTAIKLNSWIAVILGGSAWFLLSFQREEVLALRAIFPSLRSAFERTFVPELSDLSILQILFGVDFGNVYTFVPIVGLLLQVGVFGIVAIFIALKFNIKKALVTFLFFGISPQLWYSIPYIALPFLFVAIDRSARLTEKQTQVGEAQPS